MKQDFYLRVVLTIIAACLVTLTFRDLFMSTVHAKTSTDCTGELKANAWGGTSATIGGYKITLSCD